MFVIFCCFYDLFWVLPAVRAQVLLLSLPLLYRDSKELPPCVAFFFVWNRYQRKIVKTWGEIKKGLQSLWMTRLCSPWDYSQHDEYPADGFAEFLHPSPLDSKEMDDMLVHCNKNSVYVLDSSYRYRDFDMIELFGSPAGRALTVNNRTAAEMQPCSKSNNSTNSSSNIASGISNGATNPQNHPLSQQPLYHPLQNCGFSGTCSTIGTSLNHHTSHSTASNNFVETSDLIRYRSNHPQLHQHHHQTTNYSNNNGRTNSKIAKIWKLFDEDRIRKGTNSTSLNSNNNNNNNNNNNSSSSSSGISGSDIFSRCQSRRKSSPVQSEEKTAKDLYNEAAQLLGIKCTLSDSCRCIDCQSQYFDCDDFDTYSEYSDKSYDTEENFIVNQSYFCSGTSSHSQRDDLTDDCRHDEQDFGATENPHASNDSSSYSATPNDKNNPKGGNTNQQLHLEGTNVERDGDENEDDNGNNKSDQYLLNDTSHELYREGDVHGNPMTATGEMRRRRSNESEIGPKQQISSGNGSSSSMRDYATAGEINEPETNGNLIA